MARDLFAELGIEVRSSDGGDTKLSPEDAIKKVAQETGYSSDFLLGLAKLETRGGAATIKGDGVDTHNLFNIKDFSKDGTGIRATDKAEGSNHRYRQYTDYEESTRDLVRLLDRKYPDARVAETPQEFAQALKAGGYATDPAYVNKLTRTIGTAQGGSDLSGGALQQAPGTAGRDVFAQLGIDRNRPAGGRDLFAEAGIDPKAPWDGGGRDLFAEAGIDPKSPMPGTALQKAGDYAGAVSSGIGAGVLGIQGGIGKFLQAPAANSLAAVAGGVALADRGMTWLANKLEGMDAKTNPDIQQTAQMASQFAAEQRLENAKVGEDGGWANPMTMMARMGLGLQEDARSRTQAIMASDAATNPELLRQQQAMAQAEGFAGNLKAIADNPMAFTHTMARSVPDMLMGVGMARLAAGGKLAAATNVGDAAAAGVAKAGGTAAAQAEAAAVAMAPLQQQAVARASSAGLLSEAASSGMNVSEGIYQQVMGMPLDKLAASSDRYKELMAEVKNPYKAREILANELSDQSALPSAVVTGLGTGITNKIFGGDATAKTVAGVERLTGKELAKRVGQDTVEEVIQGVPEDAVQHGAVVQADPSAKLDVGGAIAQNAAAGLAMGGGMHGFAYGRQALGDGRAPSSVEQTSEPAPDTSPAPPEQATSSQENSPITDDAPTSAAEQALKQPVALTALDRAVELDAELAHVRERLQDETPENGYGPAFDQSRQELAAKAAMLEQERNQIAATWPQAAKGAPTSFGTDSGVKLDGTYALMSADDLVTSHTEGLQPNPLYPQELQPRDRSRSASELQVSGIVQKLDPERLGASADAATGAPIVGMDGLVESGNARTIALKRVYQANGQKAENYKAFLRDKAAQFGLDPATVDVTPKPVLVRVRSTPVNRAEFARQANASTVQRMSPSEQAKADAARLNSLEGLNPTEDGDFSNSRDFIRQFRSTLPITEQSEMMEADGRLSAAGYRRIQNAVLAKAYGDSPTLRRMTESMDNNLLNISKALLRVAPTIASARERMEAGALHPVDIAPDLVQAVEGLSALRDKGWTVAQELAQTDLTGQKYSPETAELMQFLADNTRSPRRIAEFFQRYYEALEQVGDPRQSSILGDAGPAPSRSDLLTQAREVAPNDNPNQDPQRGVDRESSLSDGQGGQQSKDTQGIDGSPEGDAATRPDATAGQQGTAEGQAAAAAATETAVAAGQGGATPGKTASLVIQKLRNLFRTALSRKDGNKDFADIGVVSSEVSARITEATGLELTGYIHSIDEASVRHIMKQHGNEAKEAARGQVAITEDDIARIPEIVAAPDEVLNGQANDTGGNESVIFKKKMGDAYVYVQEVRAGRKKLAAKTLWKVRIAPPAATEVGKAHTSETLDRNTSTESSSVTASSAANKNDIAESTTPVQPPSGENQASKLSRQDDGTDGVPDVPLQDLQALADRLKARMPNMPKVNVLADPSSAPYSLMEYINRQDAWYDVQGAMHEGEFYLFGSGLQSLEQAEHEAAHFGLRAVLGVEGLKSAMQMVWVHNASVRKQASKLQERGRLSDAEATEEVLVDIPTKELAQLKGWRKVVLKVRDFLDLRGYEKLADRLTTWLNGSLDEQQQADWFVADLVRAARDYVAGQRDGQPSGYVGATRLSRLKESAASTSAPIALSRADSSNPDSRLSRSSPDTPAPTTAAERADKLIGKPVGRAAPLDRVAHAITRATGVERVTRNVYDKAAVLLERLIPEQIKAGVVSDYGVPEAVIDQRALLQGRQRVQLRKTGALVEKLATLTRAESRVAYEWMNMKEGADTAAYDSVMQGLPQESVKVLKEVQQMIDKLSREAVRLGQLSPEAYERHKFAYLHRSYEKYTLGLSAEEKAVRSRAIAVLGEQYQGRGLSEFASMAEIRNVAPEWWGRKVVPYKVDTSLKGQKFIRLERRAPSGEGVEPLPGMEGKQPGKLQEVVYWPAGEPIPSKYSDKLSDWSQAGTWEVRDTQAGKVVLWRDFTKNERTQMGEIDEARFAIAKTLQMMIHDVEVGRYLEWMAQNYGKKDGDQVDGTVVDASERMRDTFATNEWVRVPDVKIPGTEVLKYGKLANHYLPGPIWNDVRQVVAGGRFKPFGETYAKVLSLWKTSKTALSPSVHMNNVMSNFVMADWHDVGAGHVTKALRILLSTSQKTGGITDREAAQEVLNRYQDSGGDTGSWATQEIANEQLEPLLAALEKELGQDDGGGMQAQIGVMAALQHASHGRFSDSWAAAVASKPGKGMGKAAKAMIDIYQAEDDVFRLAAWLKAKEDGLDDMAAGKVARKSFLDYSINAPWISAMRQSGWPFLAFTYRAVPMLAEIAAKKPHKLLKLMALAGGLNALGNMLAGGDDDKERKLLPEEKAGAIWGMVPKLIRMPWNDAHDSPVYLDIRRWIPVGDVFDVGQGHSAIPMLPGLMPTGPLAMLFEVVLNTTGFTGKPITQETDSIAQKTAKLADYFYKAFAPNLLLPNPVGWALEEASGVKNAGQTYAWSSVSDAAHGRTDAFGREMSVAQAIASSVGVKLGSYPADVMRRNLVAQANAKAREIDLNISQLRRQYQTRRLGRDEFQMQVQREIEKKRGVMQKLSERLQ